MLVRRLPLAALLCALTAPVIAQSPASLPCQGSDTVDTNNKTMAAPAGAFVQHLQQLVAADQRPAVAALASYPLRVNSGPHRKLILRSKADFLTHYPIIITPKVKAALASPDAIRCLFYNSNGFMIGNGEIWFDGASPKDFKIFSMNP